MQDTYRSTLLLWSIYFLLSSIFLLDLQAPLGVAVAMLYVVPLFATRWLARRSHFLTVATIGSIFTMRIGIATAGKAVTFTALTLSLGAACWIFSNIRFCSEMGLLLALWMMISWVGSCTLVPAIIVLRNPSSSSVPRKKGSYPLTLTPTHGLFSRPSSRVFREVAASSFYPTVRQPMPEVNSNDVKSQRHKLLGVEMLLNIA